jgi:hypothetical protein
VENPPASPNIGKSVLFGVVAALGVALVYGVVAEVFDLSLGLIVVGILGGWAIGWAVAQGAWQGRFHLVVPRVRLIAALIGVFSWVAGTLVGYVCGQILLPAASTPVLQRLSVAGFAEYLSSSLISPSILGLAALALVAWRAAK